MGDRKRLAAVSLAACMFNAAPVIGRNKALGITAPNRTMADTMERLPITPARNRPCPCGSGRKYKKCCWEHAKRKDTPHA